MPQPISNNLQIMRENRRAAFLRDYGKRKVKFTFHESQNKNIASHFEAFSLDDKIIQIGFPYEYLKRNGFHFFNFGDHPQRAIIFPPNDTNDHDAVLKLLQDIYDDPYTFAYKLRNPLFVEIVASD